MAEQEAKQAVPTEEELVKQLFAPAICKDPSVLPDQLRLSHLNILGRPTDDKELLEWQAKVKSAVKEALKNMISKENIESRTITLHPILIKWRTTGVTFLRLPFPPIFLRRKKGVRCTRSSQIHEKDAYVEWDLWLSTIQSILSKKGVFDSKKEKQYLCALLSYDYHYMAQT